MSKALDWDAAAKRDYIRDHGSIAYWADLPKPKSLERRPEETKTGKALASKVRSRGAKIAAEFARLSPEARVASVDHYRGRLRRVCEEERRSLPPSKKRYVGAITTVENQLLGQIKSDAKKARAETTAHSARDMPTTLHGVKMGASNRNKGGGRARSPGKANAVSAKGVKRTKSSPSAKSSISGQATKKAANARSRLRDLPPLDMTVMITGGAISARWAADERVERWMLTVLRRKGRSATAVERMAFPAATTSAAVRVNLSEGPYSVRVFGIGPDGPLRSRTEMKGPVR